MMMGLYKIHSFNLHITRKFLRRYLSNSSLAVIEDCQKYGNIIQKLNDRVRGPLEKSTHKSTALPFVFLLGNHSSGKSSFINYILQRKVQTAGVAPTDDSFTVIVPGPMDMDRDGPAFVGDPDMGFSGLRNFGPTLIHHTQLKIRSDTAIHDFMLVDSPGMIDSPVVMDINSGGGTVSRGNNGNSSSSSRRALMDRGYDFEAVVKWYASRADVVLLFFDPDKPGTTGETLSILTNALVGIENKLHIILNKADQFKKIHDFARAYGSLCWNLSKVIHRKDLPKIHTMCLPPTYRFKQTPLFSSSSSSDRNSNSSTSSSGGGEESLGTGLLDLELSREEVVREVFNAPKRRIDNEITRLADTTQLLYMHCKIVDSLIISYRSMIWRMRFLLTTSATLATGLTGFSIALTLPNEMIAGSATIGLVGNAVLWYLQEKSLKKEASNLVSEENLTKIFNRNYSRQIAEKDEYITSLWIRVREQLKVGFTAVDLQSMKRLKPQDFEELEALTDKGIPELRRRVAPTVYGGRFSENQIASSSKNSTS